MRVEDVNEEISGTSEFPLLAMNVSSSSEKEAFNHQNRENQNEFVRFSREKKWKYILQPLVLRTKVANLKRTSLLALSLSITLGVFWLLDSLKDPVFAILVSGNLKKHQPLAKMASVGGTLLLVCMMEIVSHERQKNRKKNTVEEYSSSAFQMKDKDVRDSGGRWTKMNIATLSDKSSDIEYTNNFRDEDFDDANHSSRIPANVFQTVGVAYIFTFSIMAYLMNFHPEMKHYKNEHNNEMDNSNTSNINAPEWHVLGYLQYITIESFGSVSVATFWSFANSTLTLKAAKAFYGFIIAIAQIGAITGSTVATIKGQSIPAFFSYAVLGIVFQTLLMKYYAYRFPDPMKEGEDDIDISVSTTHDTNEVDFEMHLVNVHARQNKRKMKKNRSLQNYQSAIDEDDSPINSKVFMSGVYLIVRHKYLLLILGVSCLYEISLTCLDYEMKLIGLDRFSSQPPIVTDADIMDGTNSGVFVRNHNITESAPADHGNTTFAIFMGRYGQLTNIFSLLLSYYGFPYFMSKYGLNTTLRIFPTFLVVVTILAYLALPMNLPVLFVSMSVLKAMTYSINDPAKEILYIPTSATIKFKAKFWIDVVGARFAKAIGSSLNSYAGTAERIVQYGSIPSVISAVALWVISYAIGMEFDTLLENGEVVGNEEEVDNRYILNKIGNDAEDLDELSNEGDSDGGENDEGREYR